MRYVFYQLKSVTLSCDLNIYELFSGRCCITPKLFILVFVGPTFGMMIEYANGCTFCCVKDNWWENVCLSPVCLAHLWFPHLISFVSQSVLHLRKLSFTFCFLVIHPESFDRCSCSRSSLTFRTALVYPVTKIVLNQLLCVGLFSATFSL